MARPKLPEIDKLKKRVRKRYPGSYCVQDSAGDYYIELTGLVAILED